MRELQPALAYDRIDRHAIWALRTEISLYPKAGLVSFVDNGSHKDMDASVFEASATALEGYFSDMAAAGARGADFQALNRIGRDAERRMFAATGGINTHRGAVFSLGVLAAAAGLCRATGERPCPFRICRTVERWGPPILASQLAQCASHGSLVRRTYGAPGAREEAAAGFPTITFHALPAFLGTYERTHSVEIAGLQAFYATMAVLDDNNLLYRGGPEGLERARSLAEEFLLSGGIAAPGGFQRAVAIHHEFVARNLSPGGSADLLIATLFLAAESGVVTP